ncbi:MAG TPA: tetratricopeptide repeat protein [Planctomycetota bacterium]|nr:tetratricopeptide repeat protein [Planctomycetota bacterium]
MAGFAGLALALVLCAGCLDDVTEQARGLLPFLPPSKYITRGGRKLTRAEAAYYQKLTDLSKATKVNPRDAVAYNAIGELLMQKGSYALAKRCFMDAIDFDGALSEPHHNLGVIYLYEERFNGALEELQRALKSSADDARIRMRLGQAYLGLNKTAEALKELDEGIALDDQFTPVYLEKARVLYAQHNYADAAETCRTALAHLPPPLPPVAARAKKSNIEFLDKIIPGQSITEDDTPPPTYKEEASYNLALSLKAQGLYSEALNALAGADTAADGKADVQLLRARLQDLMNDTSGALATLNLLRTARPDLAIVAKQIARMQDKLGQADLAVKTRLEAAELDQADKDLQEEAVRDAEAKQNKARIIQLYERLARIDPDNLRYRIQLAQAYDEAGIKRESALAWQEVVNIRERVKEQARRDGDLKPTQNPYMSNPTEHDLRRRCGMLCADIPGFQGKALIHFKHALELEPDDAEVHRRMGELYLQTANYPEAERHIRETLRVSPNDAKSHHNLATLLAEKKQFDDAVAEYKKAIALDPKLDVAQLNMAKVLLGQNRREDALPPLKAYCELKPLDVESRRMLADLYRDLNNRNAALSELEAIYHLEVENGGELDDVVKIVVHKWEMGEKQMAISDLEAQIEKHPSEIKLLLQAGIYYSDSKQHIRAIYTWERILNIAGNDERMMKERAEALTRLSKEYEATGKIDQAIRMAEYAGKDGDAEGWRRAAELYVKKDLSAKAADAYREVLKIKDKDADARRQLAALIQTSPKQADRDEALKLYTDYLQLMPKDENAHVNFANLLVEFNRFTEAQDEYTMVLNQNAKNTAALVGRGALYRRRGRYKDALDDYNKALEADPKLAKAYYNIALIYDYYTPDPAKAKEYYQKYLDAGGDPAKLPKEEPAAEQASAKKPDAAKKPAAQTPKPDTAKPVANARKIPQEQAEILNDTKAETVEVNGK